MSKASIDRSIEHYARWSDLRCVRYLAKMRWGSFKQVICPRCNTATDHYWRPNELRWKCKSCGSCFSVTSKTVFANRRLKLQTILAAMHLWVSGVAGKPALEIRRTLSLGGYNTAFSLISKLRESLVRGFNTGLISGIVEMDGAHASGRRGNEKRGRPLNYQDVDEILAAPVDSLLTNAAKTKRKRAEKMARLEQGGVVDPEYFAVHPPTRRIVITARRRGRRKGDGAQITRIGIARAETPEAVELLAKSYIAIPESVLATDTGTAYQRMGKKFLVHLQVNHSETLSAGDGKHNNNAESFTARQDRSEKGVYLNIEPKYLHDYAVETAFREDHRRVAPGAAVGSALYWALNVGLSHHWRGFTHGKHRDHEILVDGKPFYRSSGPPKGFKASGAKRRSLPS